MNIPPKFTSIESLVNLCHELPADHGTDLTQHDAREASLTKPAGALGRLESISRWVAAWQNKTSPSAERVSVIIFAADHGVVAEQVSAFPQEVTAQMVANFEQGGAAICALCRAHNLNLDIHALNVGSPGGNICIEDAMSLEAMMGYINKGFSAVSPEADLVCLGEMGIGNTTIAAALYHAIWGGTPTEWVGPGTGVNAEGVTRKSEVIARANKRAGSNLSALHALQKLGGAEIAAMFGALLAARVHRIPLVLDGFVTSAAAALAHAIRPDLIDHCLASHTSAENAHKTVLKKLGLPPLFDLSLRLGEGSGAALAVPIIRSSLACFNTMSTFAEASVATKDV